jgi:AhpD family alkylhydroperoxidase
MTKRFKKEKTMQARIKNPVALFPGALQALLALDKSTEAAEVPYVTRKLVHLRASQINSCSACVDMHVRELKKAGEKDERIFALAAWRETPYFTDAERAALALAEAGTRLADRPDAVPDDVWDEAARHYDEKALAALVVQIALINAFNRLNATTRQMVGAWG